MRHKRNSNTVRNQSTAKRIQATPRKFCGAVERTATIRKFSPSLSDWLESLRSLATVRLPDDAKPGILAYCPFRNYYGDDGWRLCRVLDLTDRFARIMFSDGARWRCIERAALRVPLAS